MDRHEKANASQERQANAPMGAGPGRAEIDLARLARMGMVAPGQARGGPADDFRIIKQPLLRHASAGDQLRPNLVLVTSAVAGEGKTFCAVNLALSLAMEQDHTVLLVDAHAARPEVPAVLGLDLGPGLFELLAGAALAPADCIVPTSVPGLALLAAGRGGERACELLASQAMTGLLAELAAHDPGRIVVLDAPPVLPTSEAAILAGQVGQVVLVVASGSTSERQVSAALRRLGHCARILLVCNKARAYAGSAGALH